MSATPNFRSSSMNYDNKFKLLLYFHIHKVILLCKYRMTDYIWTWHIKPCRKLTRIIMCNVLIDWLHFLFSCITFMHLGKGPKFHVYVYLVTLFVRRRKCKITDSKYTPIIPYSFFRRMKYSKHENLLSIWCIHNVYGG